MSPLCDGVDALQRTRPAAVLQIAADGYVDAILEEDGRSTIWLMPANEPSFFVFLPLVLPLVGRSL